jgi:putative Mg2+ transporter-C (MgtC) family protein
MQDLSFLLGSSLQGSDARTVAAVLARLCVSAALGAVIGIERQMKHRPAGLRTNMFMCFGAALFTIVSGLISHGGSEDTRIAAQIVTGIGFLGAGVIMHSGASVQGVTTAATIFVVAAIGMCCGAGLMIPAVVAALLVLFGLFVLGIVEEKAFTPVRTVVYQAVVTKLDDFHALIASAKQEKHTRVLGQKITNQPGSVQAEVSLQASPETHLALQTQLRQELDSRHILSFSSTDQE